MVRTQEDIVNRLRTNDQRDPLGWAASDLLEQLDYDHAKEFIKPEMTREQWAEVIAERKPPRERMVGYMEFAWEKANGCRGLSAARSMNHYANWLWLEGEEELAGRTEDYEYYGKDVLVAICGFLGLDPAQWDDGRRVNSDDE